MDNSIKSRLQTREWDEYDIVEDAKVDRHNLDLCAERQSSNVLKWLDLQKQANEKLTKAKEALTYQESKLILKARSEGVPGVDKITDTVVKAWVVTQPEYRLALKKKIKAESDVADINSGIKALEHAKEMIKVEANLWICGYYARPHVKEVVSAEQLAQRKQDTSKELQKSLTRRKRRQAEE